MKKLIDLIGVRFERLTVIREIERDKYNGRQFACKCDCGNTCNVSFNSLRMRHKMSCGCLFKELRITHGMSRKRIYHIWQGMKQRCFDKNATHYKDYGGRGITVCERWLKFENFLEDMGERPEGKSLDRINNNGDYEPENCSWATNKEQSNNQRMNRNVCFNGETHNMMEWSKILGFNYQTVISRIYKGWDVKRAFIT